MCGFITGAFGVCAAHRPVSLLAHLARDPWGGFVASGTGDLTVCLP